MVHKNKLYIATVSIKQKADDRIKTAVLVFNATRISGQMMSKTMTFVTSIFAIVMERYDNEQTDTKTDDFTSKCTVRVAKSKIPSAL